MKRIPQADYLAPDHVAQGAAHRFTGQVTVRRVLEGEEAGARARVSLVTFAPAARTFWHTHTGEQILYVVGGKGRVQTQGEPLSEIGPGDVIRFGPGEKHWHGAAPDSPLSHIAITLAGEAGQLEIDWMEEVSDSDYGAGQQPGGSSQ